MSNKENIIKKINDNFIKKQKEIKKIIDLEKNYQTTISKNNFDVLNFNMNDKFKFSSKFNYYGIVDHNDIFHWSNSFHGVDIRFMEQIEKIKSYSNLFDNSNDPDHLFYYQVLTSDKFLMDINEQFKFIKLLMYLDKSYYFIEPTLNERTKAIITLKEHNNSKFFEKKF
tara:strand:- start:6560 stop:7066 length:507 start_codon:yes stop_codon:yes gene_type:complete